jgi:hypothetical protein
MSGRDYRDIVGGALLLALGAFATFYAIRTYSLGNISRLGPGAFPAGLGILIASTGLIILVPAFWRAGDLPMPEFRPLIAVLAGVALFAVLIEHVGLVPSIFVLVFVSTLATGKIEPVGTTIIAIVLAIISVLIFKKGLGVAVPMFESPFPQWPLPQWLY